MKTPAKNSSLISLLAHPMKNSTTFLSLSPPPVLPPLAPPSPPVSSFVFHTTNSFLLCENIHSKIPIDPVLPS
jgi:hypothetical protein